MKKNKFSLITIFLVTVFISISLAQTDRDLQKSADSLMVSKEFSKAEELYLRILKKYPQHVDVLLSLGRVYMYSGKLKEAEEKISSVIRLAPEYSDAYIILANIYQRQGETEKRNEILENLKKINLKDTSQTDKIIELIAAFHKAGNYREVRKLFVYVNKDLVPEKILRDIARFELGANYSYEFLDKISDWSDGGLSFMFKPDKGLSFIAGWQKYSRFDLNDAWLSFSSYFSFPEGVGWYANLGFSTESKFLPELRADLYVQPPVYKGLSLIGAYSYLSFTSKKVSVFSIGIENYFWDNISLSYQLYLSSSLSSSHVIKVNVFGEQGNGMFGVAVGNEYENLSAEVLKNIRTTTLFGFYRYWLSGYIGILVNAAFANVKDSYQRTRIGGGISIRF